MKFYWCFFLLVLVLLAGCLKDKEMDKILEIFFLGGDFQLQFMFIEEGELVYWAWYKDIVILDIFVLGFELVDVLSLWVGFEMIDYFICVLNDVWEMFWGEQWEVFNNYNEFIVEVCEILLFNCRMCFIFWIYDDGFGFWYEFLEQEGLEMLEIVEE